jgi:hypothetical protein
MLRVMLRVMLRLDLRRWASKGKAYAHYVIRVLRDTCIT